MSVFLYLNNSLDNKWFNFKIPSQSVRTIIPSLACSPMRHLRPIVLAFYHVLAQGRHLIYKLTNLSNLSIIFFSFLHNTSYMTWTTPSLNCRHPFMCVHTSHQPYGYPPLMLCSWQWMHWNSWCNLRHLCRHYTKYWFPRGMRIITCVSFNHIQLLSSMNQHCAYQKWHLHLSRHYHYRPNANGFTSPILHNSRICCLQCNSSQGKELLQLTLG